MYRFDTKSFMNKRAGIGDVASRLFHSVVQHPGFAHMFKGTNLDPSGGLFANALQSLENSGVTDKEARQLADVVQTMIREMRSTDVSKGCAELSGSMRELVNDIHADPSLMSKTLADSGERKLVINLFDYRFPTFGRLYNAYITKHTSATGVVEKRHMNFADKCLLALFRASVDLYVNLQRVTGVRSGSGRDICS